MHSLYRRIAGPWSGVTSKSDLVLPAFVVLNLPLATVVSQAVFLESCEPFHPKTEGTENQT